MTRKKKTEQEKTTPAKRELVLTFGTYEITGEDERFYYCGNTQFFKHNRNIVEIRETKAEPAEAADAGSEEADA